MYDSNADGKVTLEEFFPKALETFKEAGVVPTQSKFTVLSQRTDQMAFSIEDEGDQAAPDMPVKRPKRTHDEEDSQERSYPNRNSVPMSLATKT
jgi:hypothetical protein